MRKLNEAVNLLDKQNEGQKKQQDKVLSAEIKSRQEYLIYILINLSCTKLSNSSQDFSRMCHYGIKVYKLYNVNWGFPDIKK